MTETKNTGLKISEFFKQFSLPTLIIGGFWVFILALGTFQGMALADLLTDTIRRFGMWGLLVLAMVPSIQSGTGPNFALPVGICCGLLAQVCAIELGFMGIGWLLASVGMAIVFGGIVGYIYGRLMNAVKGSEMTIATYTGFSITFLFCIIWMAFPFRSPKMGWMLGSGLRNTIDLNTVNATEIINKFLSFRIGSITIPTGMLLVFSACCLIVWMFFRSKAGIAISAVGINPMFARASGLNVDRSRVLANMLSTILAAVGIIIYSQSYGFAALYDAPLMMAFNAVAAILVGGATAQRSKIIHVIVGTIIFQGLLTNTPPVLGRAFPGTELTEISRLIVQNGVILYALTQVKGGEK
jgi:simple sugar transport system permease protein